MEQLCRARRVGYTAVLCAVLFRLCAAGVPAMLYPLLFQKSQPNIIKETGRNVRSSVSFSYPAESPAPVPPEAPAETLPSFGAEALDSISVTDQCNATPDLAALLERPLEWELASGEPAVLILHTHTTESYRKTSVDYAETAEFRTLEERCNMLAIGDRVTELLEAGGIRVIHDRALHDYPSYTGAYSHARKAIRAALEEHPSIKLVLDIHRDAMEDKKGRQLAASFDLDGTSCARIMLVMGTGNAGQSNPFWQTDLSLALKLTAALEQQAPGITRPIDLRKQRFNQDLAENTLLVEIGAAGNSQEEALLAAEKLAEAILLLKHGCT